MSSSTKVGKDTSLQGGVLHQTFRDLLKQREALDHQILRLQGRFFKMVEKSASASTKKIKLSTTSKKYVPRMRNHTILVEAICECMVPGKRMGMQDILCSLKKSGAYKTQSKYFYTMVNNKLNTMADKKLHKNPKIKKASRGVFVLRKKRKRTGRSKKVA